jgi:hypothetical protein
MSTQPAAHPVPMRRYFEKPEDELSVIVEHEPVCLYLEVTNRCNLLCTTCPRTYEELEPEADMHWDLFTKIVDQVPNIKRVVLHGVGEPMLVKDLPQMVAYLKARGVYVLFNTNGTLLTEKNGQALIDAGLDELRVSLDAADANVFQMVRGKDMFDRRPSRAASCPGFRCGSPDCAKRSTNSKASSASPRAYTSARSICNGWCSLMTAPSAWPARKVPCSRRRPTTKRP